MVFATLKNYQKVYLMEAEIGRMFITRDQMDEATRVLDLKGKSEDELRAIRNSVVRYLANACEEYRNEDGSFIDFKEFQKLQTNMSGITATIDNILFKMGCEV